MHDLDDDAVCIRCGFDAAEWWHLQRHLPKDQREKEPQCPFLDSKHIAQWVVDTCLLFGASVATSHKVAGLFVEGL